MHELDYDKSKFCQSILSPVKELKTGESFQGVNTD